MCWRCAEPRFANTLRPATMSLFALTCFWLVEWLVAAMSPTLWLTNSSSICSCLDSKKCLTKSSRKAFLTRSIFRSATWVKCTWITLRSAWATGSVSSISSLTRKLVSWIWCDAHFCSTSQWPLRSEYSKFMRTYSLLSASNSPRKSMRKSFASLLTSALNKLQSN